MTTPGINLLDPAKGISLGSKDGSGTTPSTLFAQAREVRIHGQAPTYARYQQHAWSCSSKAPLAVGQSQLHLARQRISMRNSFT